MKRALKRFAIFVTVLAAVVMAGSFVTWEVWNGKFIARTISGWISGSLAGAGGPRQQAMTLGEVRWHWLSGLRSFLFGGTAPFEAWDVGIWDPARNEVVHADHITGRIAVGWVAWTQILAIVPGRGTDTEVHLYDLHVDNARGLITPMAGGDGKVNIVAAFSSKKPSKPNPRSGLVITVDDAVIDNAEYTMEFPGWRAEVNHARIVLETLRYSSFMAEQETDKPAFVFRLGGIDRASGRLVLGGSWSFALADLKATKFGAARPDSQHIGFEATALANGAPAKITGRLTDSYSDHPGVDCAIDFERGGGLAAMLPGGGLVAGEPTGQVRIHGPFSHVVIDGHAANVEFRVAGIAAKSVAGNFVLDQGMLTISEVASNLGGGHIGGTVDIDFTKLDWKSRLRVQGVDPSVLQPLVPDGTDEVLGGTLEGTARAGGSFINHPERVIVSAIDAQLNRRAKGPLPQTVKLRGGLGITPKRIRLDNFRIEGGGVEAAFRGEVAPARQTIHSEVTLQGRGLSSLLARFGLPAITTGVNAQALVSGKYLEPTIDGDITARDVGVSDRVLPQVDAHVHFEHGTLAASRIRSQGFGGTVAGEIAVGLFNGPFTRRLKEPTLHVDARADHLRVHTILNLPNIRGEISGRFLLDGTVKHPTGTASLELPTLTIYGDPYHAGVFTAAIGDDGLDVERVSLERDEGGRFSGKGHVGWDGSLDVDVKPRDFPLQAIPPLRNSPVALGGLLSGAVHLGGALGKWIPSGVIEATAIRVREFLFGEGRIDMKPEGNVIKILGSFYNDFKFGVDGWITLTPKVAGEINVRFDDLPLASLIPEMKKLAEVQSKASGTAHISFDLPASKADITLELSKLFVTFTGDDEADGDRESEQFKNAPGETIKVGWDGRAIFVERLRLLDEHIVQHLATKDAPARTEVRPAGDLRIRGRLAPEDPDAPEGSIERQGSDATVKGRIELRFLELIASRFFEHTHGEAVADLIVRGPMLRPHLLGTLDLDKAELTPRGADRAFTVPRGRVVFDAEGIKVHDLRADLDGVEAIAEGRLALAPDWTPGAVNLDVTGQVSSTPLAWIFPDQISETQGHFDVSLHMRNSFPTPSWSGFVRVQDVAFREKKLGRDVRVSSGTVVLRNWDLIIGCPDISNVEAPENCQRLGARIDDASELRANGLIGLQGTLLEPRLRHLDVRVAGENLEAGSNGVFSLQLSPDLRLTGDADQLRLSGSVNLVTGRFYQNFDITNLIIQPRTQEAEPAFYAGIPLLANMELDVNAVSTGALFIKDNLADLHVSLPSLDISGTLANPILDGNVQVESGGRFTIPFLRGEFNSESGNILFEAEKEFPNKTPRLDIKASTDWQDRYDQIHHINLTVRGTYKEPDLDLSSTDGWDKNQVLAALLTGGTPDQLRRAVTDPAARNTAGGSAAGGGTQFGDLSKSLTGQLMRPIEDPLKEAIRFDLVRLELGYDSVFIKLCPVNKPTYRICGTGDVGFVSSTHYDARAEMKLTDYLSLGGDAERIEHGVDTTEDVVTRYRLQLSVRYPLF